jgi:hypothetical protein
MCMLVFVSDNFLNCCPAYINFDIGVQGMW